MSAVWLCSYCSALHRGDEGTCRRCAAARPLDPVEAMVPRSADSVPLLLHLPPGDFPYSRTHGTSGQLRAWLAPAAMIALAIAIGIGWDPLVRRYDAARALGGVSSAAENARRAELGHAAVELGTLLAERETVATQPPDWTPRLRRLGDRYRLDGNVSNATLGPLEVGVRSAWLELVSLPPHGVPPAEIAGRLQSAREELSRVTEDLSHAP
ncbi:MAG: hypothetical protein Q8P18_32290 [Pseudomonadota bacterium]|nr:hypothetical protein [Pseudomonadota bacterium]